MVLTAFGKAEKPTPQGAPCGGGLCRFSSSFSKPGAVGATHALASSFSVLLECNTRCNITPELSRDAQWSKAHGKLYLPCGLRNEAASA